MPTPFEWVNDRGVPWVGLIAAFVTGCICFLPFPSWQSLVGLITSASVLMYAGAPLSLGAFRKRLPDTDRPFRLPAAGSWRRSAFTISGLIILWSTWDTDWKLGVAILIGYAILVGQPGLRPQRQAPTCTGGRLVAAVYLIGMGIIVYISSFGPLDDPILGDYVGTSRSTAVFSVAIYYWALRSRSRPRRSRR